jgi:predicted MFS family arabinose efflux permease
LRSREFRRFWLSNTLWWHGLWAEQIVFGWLALELTDTPWKVAMLGFFRTIPLLLGVFTSVISDRFPRRKLLIALQLLAMSGIAALLLLHLNGLLGYWHLAAVSLLNGCIFAVDWPTRRAIYPDIVGDSSVIDAMLLENVGLGCAWCLGSLAGGAVVGSLGAAGALVLLIAIGCGSTIMLWRMTTRSQAPDHPMGWRNASRRLTDGLRYVRGKPRIVGVLILTVIMNGWVFPVHSLMPVFARDVLGTGATGLGVLAGGYGVGLLLGLSLVRWGRRYFSNSIVLVVGCLLISGAIAVFCFSSMYAVSLALIVVAGLGHGGFGVMQSGIVLSETSDEMRGRAMATVVFSIGCGPLGYLQISAMVAYFGAPISMGVMATVAFLCVLTVAVLLPGFARRGS